MFGAWAMRGLGGLLLLAAGLKMYGLAIEPVGRAGFFSQPWVQAAVVEWEIILGSWLVWGQYRSLAWYATTATFLIFTGVSFWQGWIGQTSCGCFGAVQVNPWIAFGIDVAALTCLAFVLRQGFAAEAVGQLAKGLRPLAVGVCGIMAMLAVFAGIGTVAFGSPAAALAYLRGERLGIYPDLVDVGAGYIGEDKEAVIHLRNWTDRPIRVVGGTSDCSCVVTRDLPVTVEPGDEASLNIVIRMTAQPGQFTRLAAFFTDDERIRTIRFRLTGQIHAFAENP